MISADMEGVVVCPRPGLRPRVLSPSLPDVRKQAQVNRTPGSYDMQVQTILSFYVGYALCVSSNFFSNC